MPTISFYKFLEKTKKENGNLFGLSILQQRKIYKEWKAQIKSGLFPLDMELPWITILAKNYIEKYLSAKQKSAVKVFEYGSGGSSLFFLKYAAEVHSVEHDENWFKLVQNKVRSKEIKGWTGYLALPEINENEEKLNAENPHHYYTKAEPFLNSNFKKYVSTIDQFSDENFDIVLVDGRSRPACIMHSMSKVKKGGLLILDNAERQYYAPQNILDNKMFQLMLNANSALICYPQFTQTNIYLKK